MDQSVVLYCVGATKAGTSWLYRTLHDHPDCALPAVKEAHYWDTFETARRDQQVAIFRRQLSQFRQSRFDAQSAGRELQAANMDRRIADISSLINVLEGDRTDDLGYLRWLKDRGTTQRLTADITPAYGMLAVESYRRMVALTSSSRVVYLLRDPLSRLWSHVRMQAERQKLRHEDFTEKANNTMWRILNRNQETHILARGNYPKTVERLCRAVPESRLRIEFCERLYSELGQRDMAKFLGISYHPADGETKAHQGPPALLRRDLAEHAVRLLRDQYTWAAERFGYLPREWADSLALV